MPSILFSGFNHFKNVYLQREKPISVPAKVLDVLDNYDNQMESFSLWDNQHVEITLHLVWVFSIL